MTNQPVVRILLAEDHDVVRAGLKSLLESYANFKVIAEAPDGRTAVQLTLELAPDIVLMDITMPGLNGVEATRQISAARSQSRVIALSMHSDRQFVSEILKAGASGYLLKSSAAKELSLAIDAVRRGEIYLSPKAAEVIVENFVRQSPGEHSSAFGTLTVREREVLQLLAEGKTNKEVAGALHVSVKTIETHRAQLMDKLGIRTVAGLTKYAIRQGLTSIDS